MSTTRQTILASRPAALVLALSLVGGLSAPFVMLPPAHAAATVPDGTTELSAAPVEQTQTVPPNIAVTFDDSGSMNWTRMGDAPPWTTKPIGGLYFKTMDWGSNGNQGSGTSGGPWRCANVIDPDNLVPTQAIRSLPMNGVYYNPGIVYLPPMYANGNSFPNADASLAGVWVDGMAVNRPLNPASSSGTIAYNNNPDLDYPSASARTNLAGTLTTGNNGSDNRWRCGTGSGSNQGQSAFWNGASPMDGASHTLSDGKVVVYPNGGPYYYRLKKTVTVQVDSYGNPTNTGCTSANCDGLHTLYNASNWEAVPITNTNVTIGGVTVNQYRNFANWYAYYRTRNQMARSALSRVFGSSSLSNTTATGGYGNDIRVAWQNLNSSTYDLPSSAIISALIDTASCTSGSSASPSSIQQSGATTTPPNCYRSAFFNWIFQIPASGGTPTRNAMDRAGKFFKRGAPGSSANSTLEDPYWQPPPANATGSNNTGNEVYCRKNFHILITDGLWNGDQNGPKYSTLTLPSDGTALPDGVTPPNPASAGVTSIYNPVHDGGDSGYASLSDIAYNYWATNLRPDLYVPPGKIVTPYLPDRYTGLFGSAGNVTGGYGAANNISAEMYFNPKNDPATWPHMSEYLVGLGVSGLLNLSENTDCSDTTPGGVQDACNLRNGTTNSSGSIGWPIPDGSGSGIAANIDDTWHAALAGRGQFFSAGNPQELVGQLTKVLSTIGDQAGVPTAAAVNASVVTVGALSFSVGPRADWSGVFQAVVLNLDGTVGSTVWDAGAKLDTMSASSRSIYTATYTTPADCGAGNYAFNGGTTFTGTTAFDCVEKKGLTSPALPPSGNDTLANRVAYLRGDQSHEGDNTYRQRSHLLGAIIHSQPVYVGYPSGNYFAFQAGTPEATAAAASNGTDDKSYDAFTAKHGTRAPAVYVGANDGMLHAFSAPTPTCTFSAGTQTCDYHAATAGIELWAFVPRAVYANLGNLTSVSDFEYRPTVDSSPITRDVFFSQTDSAGTTHDEWHTILAGGVGVGGRGVYALDITDPTTFSASSVLWEFDSDMTVSAGCVPSYGSCRATDLGYTVGQPNIGRLKYNNKWVVLVPNGYFPDCSKPDFPTADLASCQAIAAQAPKDASSGKPYSALFVLDAQTGKMIAELKTPTTIAGVTSFGLATPVMGDYEGDQIDDVAFAGDAQGNLWRFDLSSTTLTDWSVTLVYKGLTDANGNQGLQPITTMPRLFPDPSTNRFMVVFGTGKYLGAADNGNNAVQALYGVRDVVGTPYSQTDLVRQYMHETLAPATLPDGSANPNAGATLRCVTGGASDDCTSTITAINPSSDAGGWFVNLYVPASATDPTSLDLGERVVVSPGAIFASNTVVFETLLTGASGSDPCNPSTQGAVLALNAISGAPAGVSQLGGWPIAGARISNARTSGSLPLVSALGGGQAYLPGITLAPSGTTPLSIDAPIWRRRSWQGIQQN